MTFNLYYDWPRRYRGVRRKGKYRPGRPPSPGLHVLVPKFIPRCKRAIVSPFPVNKANGLSIVYYGLIGTFWRRGMPLRLFHRLQRRSKFTPRPKHVA